MSAAPAPDAPDAPGTPDPPLGVARRRPGPGGVWFGLAVIGAGLVAIVLGWGLVAAETDVRDQLAPLVAAGIGGLALVVIGAAVLHASAGRRDEDEHDRQLTTLAEVLEEIRAELGAGR